MVSLNVTLVLGWLEAGLAFSTIAMSWARTADGNSSRRSCEGMNVTSHRERSASRCERELFQAHRANRTVVASVQSAAAAVGCCFIIASIPFFISLAVGSALCVPTIHV